MSEQETEAVVPVKEECLTCIEEENDQSLIEGLVLPTHKDVTDQSILTSVRDVFRGFSFDASEDFSSRFADLSQLAGYVTASSQDIQITGKRAEASSRLQKAAISARFWCMCEVLHKTLDESKYGSNAAAKLGVIIKKSASYVQRLKHVGENLTMTDCYLLGMRGCSYTTMLTLAELPDDNIRRGIITAFVNTITDTSDRLNMERAKRALVNAINVNKGRRFEALSTSDPTAGGSDIMVTEQYQNVMDVMQKWQRKVRSIADEEEIENFCSTLADFSIHENTPEAELHLEEVKQAAIATKERLQAAINNLSDGIRELDSLAGVEVLHDEAADITTSD